MSAGRSASGFPTKSFFLENIFSSPRSWTRGAAVDLGAGHVALLDAERAERLQPVGLDRELLPGLEQLLPDGKRVVRPRIDLVGALAGEGEPRDEHLDAGDSRRARRP